MIAKAYVVIEDKYNAMHFALLCVEFTLLHIHEMKDFDVFYANEMMARVATLNGDKAMFEKHYAIAKKAIGCYKESRRFEIGQARF